jgi:hypothetical protein
MFRVGIWVLEAILAGLAKLANPAASAGCFTVLGKRGVNRLRGARWIMRAGAGMPNGRDPWRAFWQDRQELPIMLAAPEGRQLSW